MFLTKQKDRDILFSDNKNSSDVEIGQKLIAAEYTLK